MAQVTTGDNSLPQNAFLSPNADSLRSPATRRPLRRQASYTPPSRRYQQIPLEDQDIAEVEDEYEGTKARDQARVMRSDRMQDRRLSRRYL